MPTPALAEGPIGWAVVPPGTGTPEQWRQHVAEVAAEEDKESEFEEKGLLMGGGASTNEAEITDEIRSLAYGLQNDPIRIFEYVRNHIDYSIYHGSRNGAAATLLGKRGNDVDQCSLLIALLKAADPGSDAHYVEGDVVYAESFLANLYGVDEDQVLGVLGTFLIPGLSQWPNVRITHFWVETTINGTNCVLDPAFVVYTNIAGLGVTALQSAMGYDRAGFVNNAMSGASQGSSTELAKMNESRVRHDLRMFSTNLVAYFRNSHPNATIDQIVSGRRIVPQEYPSLPTNLPGNPQIMSTTPYSALTDAHYATLTITHPPPAAFTNTFKTYEIAGKRVSIFYTGSNKRPQLRVNGALVKEAGSGTVTNGAKFALKLVTTIPYTEPHATTNWPTLTATNYYVIAQDFGTVSPELMAAHNEELTKARLSGAASSSEAVLGGTLNIMALSWLYQKHLAWMLSGRLRDTAWTLHYAVGLMAQEAGFYIDIPQAYVSIRHASGSTAAANAWFWGAGCAASGFEHGIIEQTHGIAGASTMKLLQLSNGNGQTNYLANTANWESIKTRLQNYSAGQLAQIGSLITNQGCTAVLPRDADISDAGWVWEGLGYVAYSDTLVAMIIAGDYEQNGGYLTQPGVVSSVNVLAQVTAEYCPRTDSALDIVKSPDPVDLRTGDCLFERSDLTVGSVEPRGLRFARSYNSAQHLQRDTLGFGWTHNYDIEAFKHSHGDPALGCRTPADAASMIAYTIVLTDLLQNELNIKGWMATALSTKWAIDQLVDNATTISHGDRSTEFIKLADNSFNSPPGITAKLIGVDLTNGTYRVEERFGTRMEFHTVNATGRLQSSSSDHYLTIEAEDFSGKTDRAGHSWSNIGGYCEWALPNDGTSMNNNYETTSPQLDFDALFVVTGQHRVWVHGWAASSDDDSCHAGIDGSGECDHIHNFDDPYSEWHWSKDLYGGGDAKINIKTAGYHRVNIWMRQDGFAINRIVLTTSSSDDAPGGGGGGPAESPLHALAYCKLSSWEDADGNKMQFAHNGRGNLYAVSDSYGRQLAFSYDSSGSNLTSVSDSSGRSVSFSYNDGRLTACTDAEGKQWTYTYDTNHWLTSIKDPLNQITVSNRYDAMGVVTSQVSATGYEWKFFINRFRNIEQNPDGGQTLYWFDDKGREVSREDPLGNRVYKCYDGQNHVTNAVDARGYATVYQYDAHHNVTNIIDALSQKTACTYDSQHHLVEIKNPLGQATRYGYDSEHHLTNVVDALNNATITAYLANGLPSTVTDARGNTSAFTYDNYGNPRIIQRTDGGAVTNSYNVLGDLTNSVDPLGHSTAFRYDKRRLLLRTQDALGYVVSNLYNNAGQLVSVKDPKGYITSNTFTKAYKVSSVRYPNGGVVSNLYNSRDLLVAVIDPLGRSISNQYDAAGRLTNVIDALRHTVSYTYDANGNLLTARDELGNQVASQYDALNRIVTSTDQLGNDTDYEFDAAGRLAAVVDPSGARTEYQYDAAGRRTAIQKPGSVVESFEYDPVGNLLAFVNGEGKRMTFAYDAMGRVIFETNALGFVTRHTYDPVGNRISRTDAKSQTVNYSYDPVNLLTNALYPDGSRVACQYDANRNMLSVSSVNSVVTFSYDSLNRTLASTSRISSFEFPVSYSYDLAGNRTNITYPGALKVAYAFDAANRLTAVRDWTNRVTTYAYDEVDRLTGIDYPNGVDATYTLDAAGRVAGYGYEKTSALLARTITRNALGHKVLENIAAGLEPMPPTQTVETRTHDPADRMTNIFTQTAPDSGSGTTNVYAYDANGNLVSAPSASQYSWDYDNRLTNHQSSICNLQFVYDGLGDRITRHSTLDTRHFVLDRAAALHNILVEVGTNGAPLRYYIWGANGLLAQVETNGTVYYAHPDELGSTLALTDTNGNLVAQYAYGPNGEDWGYTGTIQTVYTFIGGHGVYHEGDDLYFMQARYYSAEYKRFLSQDPLGLDAGFNLYLYAAANPLFFVDPLGLCRAESGYSYYDGPSWGQGGSYDSSYSSYNGAVIRAPDNYARYDRANTLTYGQMDPSSPAAAIQAEITAGFIQSAIIARFGPAPGSPQVLRESSANFARRLALQTGDDVVVPAGTQGVRTMMADLSAASGNEVALLRLQSGGRVLRMGGPSSVRVGSDVSRVIAHTHPSGSLSLSARDILTIERISQGRALSTVIVDPKSAAGARIFLSSP